MMEGMRRRTAQHLWNFVSSHSSMPCRRSFCGLARLRECVLLGSFQKLLDFPWLAHQLRGLKITGSEVKVGNIIDKNGNLYEVIKAQHTQHGRGGASIQVELRDLEKGLKLTERLRTSETIERVHLEDRTFTFLYEDGDTIVVMDPETFEQVELSKETFGKRAAYLTDGMPVTVSFHEGRALSGSLPIRVTCTVAEAEPSFRGQSISAQDSTTVLKLLCYNISIIPLCASSIDGNVLEGVQKTCPRKWTNDNGTYIFGSW